MQSNIRWITQNNSMISLEDLCLILFLKAFIYPFFIIYLFLKLFLFLISLIYIYRFFADILLLSALYFYRIPVCTNIYVSLSLYVFLLLFFGSFSSICFVLIQFILFNVFSLLL